MHFRGLISVLLFISGDSVFVSATPEHRSRRGRQNRKTKHVVDM